MLRTEDNDGIQQTYRWPLDHFFDLKRRHENMGHAFAAWGIGPGCLLILPFSSAVNVRDQVGGFFDSVLDLKIVIPYAGSISGLNRTVSSYDSFNSLAATAADPYEQFKIAMSAVRFSQLRDFQFSVSEPEIVKWSRKYEAQPENILIRTSHYYQPDHPLTDSLRSRAFSMQRSHSRWWSSTSLWNSDFYNEGTIRSVRNPEDPEDAPERDYQFWNEPDETGKAPSKRDLVVIIPGIGAHYTGRMVRALAELFSDNGYAAVATTSTMNWSFAVTKESAFPGYPPADAVLVRNHIQAILKDLKENKSFEPDRLIIAGYSLGALQLLHLAAAEEQNNTLGVSRFIALNPPVDLVYAMERFEEFGSVLECWTKQEMFEHLGSAITTYVPYSQGKFPFQEAVAVRENIKGMKNRYKPALTYHQAAGMFYFSYRMVFRELLLSNARNGFLPEDKFPYKWGNRTELYRKIDKIGGHEYLKQFLLPQHPGMTPEEFRFRCSLRSIAPVLKNNPRVFVIHNLDDPLISEDDAEFLSKTVGGRMIWFDRGAHLGNHYLKEYHKNLLGTMTEKTGNPL